VADHRVCRRYAQALFVTAQKHDTIGSVESDLNTIVGLMDSNESFKDFIVAPYTGRDEKVATLERMFSDRITALTMQVLRVMLEKRREEEIEGVRDEYVKLRRENGGVIFATVTSTEPLDDAQKSALTTKLQSVLGKQIEAEYKTDPNLLGGIRVAYGNYILDGSVRGALSNLRGKLQHDLLKQQ